LLPKKWSTEKITRENTLIKYACIVGFFFFFFFFNIYKKVAKKILETYVQI